MADSHAAPVGKLPLGQRQRLLLRLLRLRSPTQLKRAIARFHPADLATLFPSLRLDEQQTLLQVLFEMRLAAPTLRELDTETRTVVLEQFPDAQLGIILSRMPADDAVDVLTELDGERRKALLESIEPALAARLNNLMIYGETTAGGIMDPDVIFFRADQTVSATLQVIRRLAESRRLFYLYVADDRGHLIGLVKLWQLLTAEGDRPLREIMGRDVLSVSVDAPQDEVAALFSRYDLPIMPVLDRDGRLVGVITVDDVIDVIEEEASEDLYRLGGLPEPETFSTPIGRSIRLRLPWLLLSIIGSLFAAWVLFQKQELIAEFAALAALAHLIAATCGFGAKQTLTVVTVFLEAPDSELWHTWRIVGKQLMIGLINGSVTGIILAAIGFFFIRDPRVALIVGLAQIASLTTATAMACGVPLVLWKARRDPALGSSAVVIAFADLGAFWLFLSLVVMLT